MQALTSPGRFAAPVGPTSHWLKIGSLSAADFLRNRGARGSAKRGLSVLRRAGTQPPRPGDERG